MQEQRISELEAEITTLTEWVEELRDTLQQTDADADRIDVLQQREQCNEERDGLQAKMGTLRRQREAGFPEKHRKFAIGMRLMSLSNRWLSHFSTTKKVS